MKNVLVLILISFLATQGMNAQKFGYVNSTAVLAEHPDIKAADQQLITFQNDEIAKGQKMVTDFEAKYQAYVQEANNGTLSQLQMQEKEAALAQEQQAIQKFEMEVQQSLVTKREELYAPILDRVRVTLEDMGKEMGYTFIFDSSAGVLLHATSSEDLTDQLKSKLGI